MTIQSPYVVVITHSLRTMAYLRIPQADPALRETENVVCIPPSEVIEHPFLKKDVPGLLFSKLRIPSIFVPSHLRTHNVCYLQTHWQSDDPNIAPDPLNIIVEFTKPPLHPPRVIRQSKKIFGRLDIDDWPLHFAGDHVFTLSSPYHPSPSILKSSKIPYSIKSYPYIARRGNFIMPVEKIIQPVEKRGRRWSTTQPGTLCAVSGTATLISYDTISWPEVYVVRVLRFK